MFCSLGIVYNLGLENQSFYKKLIGFSISSFVFILKMVYYDESCKSHYDVPSLMCIVVSVSVVALAVSNVILACLQTALLFFNFHENGLSGSLGSTYSL